MIGPFSRILARYIAAGLVAYGLASEDVAFSDDMLVLLGGLVSVGTEAAYAFAKRKGWAT